MGTVGPRWVSAAGGGRWRRPAQPAAAANSRRLRRLAVPGRAERCRHAPPRGRPPPAPRRAAVARPHPLGLPDRRPSQPPPTVLLRHRPAGHWTSSSQSPSLRHSSSTRLWNCGGAAPSTGFLGSPSGDVYVFFRSRRASALFSVRFQCVFRFEIDRRSSLSRFRRWSFPG